jgi:hypothetical protein
MAGPLELPDVPDAVAAEIPCLEERQVQVVEPLPLDQPERLVPVDLPEGRQQVGQHLAHETL